MDCDITIDAEDVRDTLDGDADDGYDIEIRMAEALVNDRLADHTDEKHADLLELTGVLVAAAYAEDDGHGQLSSITQGSAQVSWTPDGEDALSFWRRAKQMDPSGRLGELEKPTASIAVPDVRGGR